ncbi:MAG: glycoside hydrolase family 73 protein [Lutibacter sp.]|jgi:flagellum-specific peptidoglycan hydrolase FlgJ
MLTRLEFIRKYKEAAIQNSRHNMFPSVLIAQAILESNTGNSILASEYNNLFGVKASKDWTGKTVNLQTREVFSGQETFIKDNFRVYSDPGESFRDRVQFLKDNPRYEKVFYATTPQEQAELLQSAGYATDPNYAESIIDIIEQYDLTDIDKTKQIMKKLDYAVILMAALIIVVATWYKIFKY